MCAGAKVYGDLYLTLRGGLAASLARLEPTVDDADNRRLIQRGTRRILALGWLSVEDDHAATVHPYRIPDIAAGESFSKERAKALLRQILVIKHVNSEPEQDEWISDCLPSLTAAIRADAVWVNRAAAFAAWQKEHGANGDAMPEQASRILFSMCGDKFATLSFPDERGRMPEDEGDPDEDDSEVVARSSSEVDSVEPSKASRRVFGDLFGGDAAQKVARAKGKNEFALALRQAIEAAGTPTRDVILTLRAARGLAELDARRPEKYPQEVSSSGHPTAVAERYRKLLVSLGLWPSSDEENGQPRAEATRKFRKQLGDQDVNDNAAQINAWDLLEACPKAVAKNVEVETDSASERVRSPVWAQEISDRVADMTRMPANAKSLNEFKRLMFALAARRISQTQSWTKRNELERHGAAVRQDSAEAKLADLDPDGKAQVWLRQHEEDRHADSNALTEFQITNRMIGECEAVFKAWQGCQSAKEREDETARVQADAEKFGDAELYSDLSTDARGEVIWKHPNGAEILANWVKYRKAQSDQQRFKIPRFCHPDPFRHPTWCEFGETSKPGVWYEWNLASRPRNPEPGGNADGLHRLWLLLPNFESGQSKAVPLRWRCKRLCKDLGGLRNVVEKQIPRADRASLAAAQLPHKDSEGKAIRYRPAYPFSPNAKGWNARLQADRDSLIELEKQWDELQCTWRDGGKKLRSLSWFVTFAPTLEPSDGSGRAIHPKLGWKSGPLSELNRKEKRERHAKVILSRLPGLRTFNLDLGHRFAGACVVWESLSLLQFQGEVSGRKIIAGGTADSDLYCHTRHVDDWGKWRTTIYRRIAEDYLRDPKTGKMTEMPHPAPWARLDRQFLIKLPGEEVQPRAASKELEEQVVERFCQRVGMKIDEDKKKGRDVRELTASALRVATLALRRHARRAKIAYAFDPATRIAYGTGGKETEFDAGSATHFELLTDALVDWHSLASDSRWDDLAARNLWNEFIKEPLDPELFETRSRTQRKAESKALLERLEPTAKRLARSDFDGSAIHSAWKMRWENDDGLERRSEDFKHELVRDESGKVTGSKTRATRETFGFHADLRWLTDWIMGWRLAGASSNSWTRNVGGLSLDRIANIRSLYQLHKAFAMRPRPDKPRGAPAKGESNAGIAKSILLAMERLRNQRVKQLASRIAASALGLGGHWKTVTFRSRHKDGKPITKRRSVWQEDASPKYATCHAVVIESLRNYRPDELQTRRENRGLMNWSAAQVRKYLEEACQLHGLYLREVLPDYTSRQDSRTGLPGLRCSDVPVKAFLSSARWRKALNAARRKKVKGSATKTDRLLLDLHAMWNTKWDNMSDEARKRMTLRLPVRGGDLFMAAVNLDASEEKATKSGASTGLQADLNAAANIGLRALLDPDFPGKWWYVLCTPEDGRALPKLERVAGSSCFASKASDLRPLATNIGDSDVANYWCDPVTSDVSDKGRHWRPTKIYWRIVADKIARALRDINRLADADNPF
jgi:hypothetical protein